MDHGDDIKAIGQAIKAMRERMALKQTDVAGRSGKSQSKVSQLENGEADPRLSTLIAVAKALNCEVALVPKRSAHLRSFFQTFLDLGEPKGVVRGLGQLGGMRPPQAPLKFYGGGEAIPIGTAKLPAAGSTRNAAFDDVFIPDPDQEDGEKG